MPITLEELARAAGVSRATASRALHGSYPVKEATYYAWDNRVAGPMTVWLREPPTSNQDGAHPR